MRKNNNKTGLRLTGLRSNLFSIESLCVQDSALALLVTAGIICFLLNGVLH